MPAEKKWGGIQALRALSIFLIVLSHLTVVEAKFGTGSPLLPPFLGRGTGGLDLFFIISGLMMVTITRGKYCSALQALTFLYHRLVRIYPLYWIYSLLVLPVYFIRPDWVNSDQGNRVDLLASFLLLPSTLLPLLNVAWMLVHLLYFYLIFSLFLWLIKEEHLLPALMFWALLVGGGQIYFSFHPSLGPALDLLVHPYTLEFLTGCFLGLLLHRSRRRWGGISLTSGLILYFGALALLNLRPPEGLVTGWTRVLLFGPPGTLIVYGVTVLEGEGRLSFPGFLKRLGDASYSIYLSHIPVLVAAGRLWSFSPFSGWFFQGLALLTLSGLAIIYGLLSYRFLEAPLVAILRAGGRGLEERKIRQNGSFI